MFQKTEVVLLLHPTVLLARDLTTIGIDGTQVSVGSIVIAVKSYKKKMDPGPIQSYGHPGHNWKDSTRSGGELTIL